MEVMFRYHVRFPWFNEKYNPALPFVNLRRRVRREGWDGLVDKFIRELEDGQHDPAGIEATSTRSNPTQNNERMFTQKCEVPDEKDEDNNDQDDEEPIPPAQDGESGDDATVDPMTTVGDVANVEVSEKLDPRELHSSVKGDRRDDEVMVEPDGNQVLIRTIPPDIGRVKLEKVNVLPHTSRGVH